jgi:hypothetical protein
VILSLDYVFLGLRFIEDLPLNFLLNEFLLWNLTVFDGSYSQKMLPFLFSSPLKSDCANADSLTKILFCFSSYIFKYILFPLNFKFSFCSKSYLTVCLHSFINSRSNGKPEVGS